MEDAERCLNYRALLKDAYSTKHMYPRRMTLVVHLAIGDQSTAVRDWTDDWPALNGCPAVRLTKTAKAMIVA
jgi:hypothetical protein